MKKIIFIFLFLISLVSCNQVHNDLNVYNGMTKNELLGNYKIKINDFHDLGELVLVRFESSIYVVKFDRKNKVEDYDVLKMKNNIKKNREEYSKSLDKIDFYEALSTFGLPEDITKFKDSLEFALKFYINLEDCIGNKRTCLRISFRYEDEIYINTFNQYYEDYLIM